MTAREYLNQYKEADQIARRLGTEYEKERELLDAIRSTADIDGLPHGNGIKKPVEDKAVRLADKMAEWKIAELDALHIRQEIFETIHNVGGDAAEVLFARYVKLMTWTEVCVCVHWSWYKVRNLHEQGLARVEELLK